MKTLFSLLMLLSLAVPALAQDRPAEKAEPKIPEFVLVFTKTEGFRHKSIEKGVQALRELGRGNGFIALQSESGEDFTPDNLKNFALVVFLNTTGDVLNDVQQGAFEAYIRQGGNYLGIHAASDTEFDWPWYGRLVGGYFEDHPEVQRANIQVVDGGHPATAHLPKVWTRTDEWYNLRDLNAGVTVLMNLDESSYKGGTLGEKHPVAWYHEFEGGRALYTAGGHTEGSFGEPEFRQHLLGALKWCLGRK